MNELKLDTLKKLSGGGAPCGRDKGQQAPKSDCKSGGKDCS